MKILIVGSNIPDTTIVELLKNTDIDAVIVPDNPMPVENETMMYPYHCFNDVFYDLDKYFFYLDKDVRIITTNTCKHVTSCVTMQAKQHVNKLNIPQGFRRRVC